MEKDFQPSHSVTFTGVVDQPLSVYRSAWAISNSWGVNGNNYIQWGKSPIITEEISISQDSEIESEVARLISDMER